MKYSHWILILLLAWCVATISCSESSKSKGNAPAIVVENAWSRPSMSGAHEGHHDMNATGVVYLRIQNNSQQTDRLLSVASDVAHVVEIHETKMVDGKMTMTPLKDGVPIPAGESVSFEPHGKHIMLIGLLRDLTENDSFKVKLQFEKAGSVEAMSHIKLN